MARSRRLPPAAAVAFALPLGVGLAACTDGISPFSTVACDGVSVHDDRVTCFYRQLDEDAQDCLGARLDWSGPAADRTVHVEFVDERPVDVVSKVSEYGRLYVDLPYRLEDGHRLEVVVEGQTTTRVAVER